MITRTPLLLDKRKLNTKPFFFSFLLLVMQSSLIDLNDRASLNRSRIPRITTITGRWLHRERMVGFPLLFIQYRPVGVVVRSNVRRKLTAMHNCVILCPKKKARERMKTSVKGERLCFSLYTKYVLPQRTQRESAWSWFRHTGKLSPHPSHPRNGCSDGRRGVDKSIGNPLQ